MGWDTELTDRLLGAEEQILALCPNTEFAKDTHYFSSWHGAAQSQCLERGPGGPLLFVHGAPLIDFVLSMPVRWCVAAGQGWTGSCDLGRRKNIHRAVGMLDMPLFKGGRATHAASQLPPAWHCLALHGVPLEVPVCHLSPRGKSQLPCILREHKASRVPTDTV